MLRRAGLLVRRPQWVTVEDGLDLRLALGIILTVPWTQTNQNHKIEIDLVDQDTKPVMAPEERGGGPVAHAEASLNVGRPPELQPGEDESVAFAINMPGLTVSQLGRYRFLIKIDGDDVAEVPWTVAAMPGMNLTGLGPTALPRF